MRAEAAAKCPICARPATEAFKPFCSKRCADADLLSWLKGGYAIPGPPLTPGEAGEKDPDED